MEKKKILVIVFLAGLTVISFLIINHFLIIRPNIYFKIKYNISVSNENELIERVELFNYSQYLDCSNEYYTCEEKKCFIDRESINCFKSKISSDKKFHINPLYYHYFLYNFNAEAHSEVSLSYNNNTIFNCTYFNNKVLFGPSYTNILYLNFSMLPYVYNSSNTLLLSDIVIVDIHFFYTHRGDFMISGISFELQQYLIMDSNYNFLLIYIPFLLTAP